MNRQESDAWAEAQQAHREAQSIARQNARRKGHWVCEPTCDYPIAGHSVKCREANWPKDRGTGTLHEQKREIQKMPETTEKEKEPTKFLLTLEVTALELAELEKAYTVETVRVANKGVIR